MLNIIGLRRRHGYQAIRDLGGAKLPEIFRGFPLLDDTRCPPDCSLCVDACPVRAAAVRPLRIDMASCIFCGGCARVCPEQSIRFSSEYRLGCTERERLTVTGKTTAEAYIRSAVSADRRLGRFFKRSLKLRQVSAGGCNGCEMELAAAVNVNFDMNRFNYDFTASPRHADGIVITGPVTKGMAAALRDTYESLAPPRLVVAVGTCALSGGLFSGSDSLERSFFSDVPVDLWVPGCPVHPLTFIHAVRALLNPEKGHRKRSVDAILSMRYHGDVR